MALATDSRRLGAMFHSAIVGGFFDLEPEKEYKIISRKKDFEDMIQSVSTIGKRANDTMTMDFL